MSRYSRIAGATVVVCVLVALLMTGCGGKEPTPPASQSGSPPTKPAEQQFWRIGTASLGGNFFPMGATLGEVLGAKMPGIKFTPEATNGSAYNMGAVDKKDLEIALCLGPAVAEAINGTGSYAGQPVSHVQTIANCYATATHVMINKNLKISRLQDLKGKRIEMIAPGDGIEANSRKILEAVGVKWEDIKPEYSGNRQQAAARLKSGEVDAIIDGTGIQSAWTVDVIGDGRMYLLSMTDDEISKVSAQNKEFSKTIIPAKAYNGQPADVQTVANWTYIVCQADLSEDLIYTFTKELFANKADLASRHKYYSDLKPENIVGAVIAPLHKGAEKYFKEIGILK